MFHPEIYNINVKSTSLHRVGHKSKSLAEDPYDDSYILQTRSRQEEVRDKSYYRQIVFYPDKS